MKNIVFILWTLICFPFLPRQDPSSSDKTANTEAMPCNPELPRNLWFPNRKRFRMVEELRIPREHLDLEGWRSLEQLELREKVCRKLILHYSKNRKFAGDLNIWVRRNRNLRRKTVHSNFGIAESGVWMRIDFDRCK